MEHGDPERLWLSLFFIIWRHFNPHALVDTRQKSSTNAKQGKSSVKMPNQALFTNQFIWKVWANVLTMNYAQSQYPSSGRRFAFLCLPPGPFLLSKAPEMTGFQ